MFNLRIHLSLQSTITIPHKRERFPSQTLPLLLTRIDTAQICQSIPMRTTLPVLMQNMHALLRARDRIQNWPHPPQHHSLLHNHFYHPPSHTIHLPHISHYYKNTEYDGYGNHSDQYNQSELYSDHAQPDRYNPNPPTTT